ncbi:MAG: hypothetical protein GC164_00645 [Phycisphaera sp.]|nr:hypothetical protein [Phycisphaera sp.]
MKQFILLTSLLMLAGFGGLYHPFWAIIVYYALAMLRPNYLWQWALPTDVRWSLCAAVLVVVSILLHSKRFPLNKTISPAFWLTLAFSGWIALSCITAYDPNTAAHYAYEYGKILLIAMITLAFVDKLWQVRAMAMCIFLTLGYIAYEINFTYLIDGRLDVYHNGFGGLDNNGAGLLIALGIPFAFAAVVCAPKHWQRGVGALVGLMMLHAMLMTYSRGAMIASLVGVVWLLIKQRNRTQALAMGLVIVMAVSFLAGKEIRQRFYSTVNFEQDGSAQARFDSWSAAWEMVSDNPITGKGIRNANVYSYNYGADRQNRTIHSQYLQLTADAGIPAGALYLTILGFALWQSQRAIGISRRRLDRLPHDKEPDPALSQAIHIAAAYQSSLVIFICGACFLSLDFFEVAWLLIVMSSLMPRAVENYLDEQDHAKARSEESPHRKHARKRTAIHDLARPIVHSPLAGKGGV